MTPNVWSPRLIALRRAKGLQGTAPGDDLIEHTGDRRLQMGTWLEGREILKIGEEGEADLRPHVAYVGFGIAGFVINRRSCRLAFPLRYGRGLDEGRLLDYRVLASHL